MISEKTKNRWLVYRLIDPLAHEVRYIGITLRPKGRLDDHIKMKCRSTKRWVQALRNKGEIPLQEFLCSGLTETQALSKEAEFISVYLESGSRLCNCKQDYNRALKWKRHDQTPSVFSQGAARKERGAHKKPKETGGKRSGVQGLLDRIS